MKRFMLMSTLMLVATGLYGADDGDYVFKLALEGRECTIDSSGQRNCRFRFGDDLDFEIVDIESPYVSVIIYKVKTFGDADYYMKFGGVHGCIIISGPDLFVFAFIHPRTAEIFLAYKSCWPSDEA